MYVGNADKLFFMRDFPQLELPEAGRKAFSKLADLDAQVRMSALEQLHQLEKNNTIPPPAQQEDFWLFAPTWYSFSAMSPSMMLYAAHRGGYSSVAITDYASVAGLREFINAGRCFPRRLSCNTVVVCNLEDTPFAGKQLNHHEAGTLLLAATDIPLSHAEQLDAALLYDIRAAQNVRTACETWALRSLLHDRDILPDFWNEAIDYSMFCYSSIPDPPATNFMAGSVSIRHVFYTFARHIISKVTAGENVCRYLTENLDLPLSPAEIAKLKNPELPKYAFFLTEILYRAYYPQISYSSFAHPRLPQSSLPLAYVADIMQEVGARPTYIYTGSLPEDACLDALAAYLSKNGIRTIAYNERHLTEQQKKHLAELCAARKIEQMTITYQA